VRTAQFHLQSVADSQIMEYVSISVLEVNMPIQTKCAGKHVLEDTSKTDNTALLATYLALIAAESKQTTVWLASI
jgi:hypothetical protein